jgi:hypothetical protein
MRKLLGVLAVGFIAMGVVGQAHAATLPFSGTLSINLSTLAPVTLPGSGTATVNGAGVPGHLTALQLPASPFSVAGLGLPVTNPDSFPIAGVQITAHNTVGNFVGSGGAGFTGIMPIVGFAKVCLFNACKAAVANLSVPLDLVGAGGSATVTGPVNVTVVGAPWTTGIAAIGTVTRMGSVAPGSNTGAAGGNVQLVTPIFISTNVGPSAVVPAFATMTIAFTPEPGTLAALGAALVTLVAMGRSRRR